MIQRLGIDGFPDAAATSRGTIATMSRVAVIIAVALAVVAALATFEAQAAPADWVGSARCGSCHPRQLAA